jgi:thiol-disulfide isomerase/thioredoxin
MEKVAYLEIDDFNKNGTLKPYVNQGFPVVVMVQAGYCGYCTKAKPDFQQFAKMKLPVVAACIVSDGSDSEKQAASIVKQLDPSYQGVPHYMGFDKNGKFIKPHNGNRKTYDLIEFAKTI